MASWLGSLRTAGWQRIAVAVFLVALLAAGAYQVFARTSAVEPHLAPPPATATIGEGSDAVAVGPEGAILDWLPLSDELQLPRLPISEPPPKGELGGEVLEQALVLGAAPAALRPYMDRSRFGEAGVAVELRAGIELLFGDATRLEEKWRAAVAVLADPEVTEAGYVDLRAPRRPAVGGSGHTLPAIP